MPDLAETIEELGRTFNEFKAANDERLNAIEKGGTPDGLLTDKVERMAAAITDINSLKERLEDLENAANRPNFDGGKSGFKSAEHLEAFTDWVRTRSNEAERTLKGFENELKKRGVDTQTGAAGGHAVPEILAQGIEKNLLDISPMRRYARVIKASSSDFKKLVNVRGAAGGWVGETDTRGETNTSQLEEVAPTFGTVFAYPTATEESLQDIFFNVEQWIREESVEALAQMEGAAFVSGNGTKKPTGFLNGTPVTTADGARPFGVLQYVKTGAAADFAGSNPADVLIDAMYSLKAGYRGNANWMMNKNTLGKVMKFKDGDGNYLWAPGLQAGQPSTIRGYPVAEAEDMPSVGANTFPVAFGDFRAGYMIVDLVGMRMTVDDNLTEPGYIKFYIRRRVGGKVLKSEAIKLIKCEA
nr:phage capsid protein [bacterium]